MVTSHTYMSQMLNIVLNEIVLKTILNSNVFRSNCFHKIEYICEENHHVIDCVKYTNISETHC